jgi:hypothetical protein
VFFTATIGRDQRPSNTCRGVVRREMPRPGNAAFLKQRHEEIESHSAAADAGARSDRGIERCGIAIVEDVHPFSR